MRSATDFLINRRIALQGGLALCALAGQRIVLAAEGVDAIVTTAQGRIRGRQSGSVYNFRGVYYAGAAQRFMPAPAPEKWTGVRDALAWGAVSPQVGAQLTGAGSVQDEHCQVLNVTTPSLRGKRPVLLWLHGGGFQFGSGNGPRTDGSDLAPLHDVVVVSINHRLASLGALWLKDLDSRYEASGVVGMLDIVAALQWVRENIAQFGGDPDNVTIFGQSGGGGKVLTLLAMPPAQGLFHRAIVMSGSMGQTSATAEQGAAQTALILKALDLTPRQVGQLATMPVSTLLAAQAKVTEEAPRHPVHRDLPLTAGLRPSSPIIDGKLLPEQPYGTRAPATSRNVPVLIGSTTKEMRRFSTQLAYLFQLDDAALRTALQPTLGARTDAAIATYKQARPDASPSDLYWSLTADSMYWSNSIHVAELKAAEQAAPVFMYRFAYDPDAGKRDGKVYQGAAHGAEMPYVFATGARDGASVSAEHQKLLQAMSGAWTGFARNGKPGWAAYDTSKRATMIFDADSHVENDPGAVERRWWSKA